jgi:wobble nucleotide-excising tRNase
MSLEEFTNKNKNSGTTAPQFKKMPGAWENGQNLENFEAIQQNMTKGKKVVVSLDEQAKLD